MRPLRLRAPQLIGRDLDVAERVFLDAEARRCALAGLAIDCLLTVR